MSVRIERTSALLFDMNLESSFSEYELILSFVSTGGSSNYPMSQIDQNYLNFLRL